MKYIKITVSRVCKIPLFMITMHFNKYTVITYNCLCSIYSSISLNIRQTQRFGAVMNYNKSETNFLSKFFITDLPITYYTKIKVDIWPNQVVVSWFDCECYCR